MNNDEYVFDSNIVSAVLNGHPKLRVTQNIGDFALIEGLRTENWLVQRGTSLPTIIICRGFSNPRRAT